MKKQGILKPGNFRTFKKHILPLKTQLLKQKITVYINVNVFSDNKIEH